MLQSEFYERTKVNLTGEDYAEVEHVYNYVDMDKDEFCKQWLKLRNNKLFNEAAKGFLKRERELIESSNNLNNKVNSLEEELKKQRNFYEGAIKKGSQMWSDAMILFAKNIVRANEDDANQLRVYEVVEQEYGIGFIIKAKHEAGIPLSEEEVNYMVGKL